MSSSGRPTAVCDDNVNFREVKLKGILNTNSAFRDLLSENVKSDGTEHFS